MMHTIKFALFGLLLILLIGCDFNGPPKNKFSNDGPARLLDKDIRQAKSVFFRIQASYELVETGEIIDFDYVLACSKVHIDPEEQKHSMTIGEGEERKLWFPESMHKATSTGAAIHIFSFRVCNPNTSSSALPFTVFHPDINDLGYGWGYATKDAYERKNTDLRYISSSVSVTNKSAFRKWLKKSRKKQSSDKGDLAPFGQYNDYAAKKWHLQESDFSGSRTVRYRQCKGYSYIKLPKASMHSLQEILPEKAGRFWNVRGHQGEPYVKGRAERNIAYEFTKHIKSELPIIDKYGKKMGRYTRYVFIDGTPGKFGIGTLSERNRRHPLSEPAPIYPFLSSPLGQWPKGVKPVENINPMSILFDDEHKGLVYCGFPKDTPFPMLIYSRPKEDQTIWFYINDVIADKNPRWQYTAGYFFDKEGGLLFQN